MKFISPERQRHEIVHFVEKRYRENIERHHPRLPWLWRFIHFFFTGNPEILWVRLKEIFDHMKLQYDISNTTATNRLDELSKRRAHLIPRLESIYTRGGRYFSPPAFPVQIFIGMIFTFLILVFGRFNPHIMNPSPGPMLVILWVMCGLWMFAEQVKH